MKQPIIDYVRQNRAGLARLVVEEALRSTGRDAADLALPNVDLLKRKVETALFAVASSPDLAEALDEVEQFDVAGGATDGQSLADEVEQHAPPPPLRKRR